MRIGARLGGCLGLAAFVAAAGCTGSAERLEGDDEEAFGTSSSELTVGQTREGLRGNLTTVHCSNLQGALCLDLQRAPLTTAEQALPYLDHAAANWGCTSAASIKSVVSAGKESWYAWYGNTKDPKACGVAYFNHAKQASFFLSNNNSTNPTTSSELLKKFCDASVGCSESGTLGLPVSNPIPYGWAGATYQLFAKGLITYHPSYGAHFLGGPSSEDQALVKAFTATFGITPTAAGGPAIYPLEMDPGCTSLTGTSCNELQKSGVYSKWRDYYWNLDSWIIAKTAWSNGVVVPGFVAAKWIGSALAGGGSAAAPWAPVLAPNGLGYPTSPLSASDPAGTYSIQEFDRGSIKWEPGGLAASCPAVLPTCSGAQSAGCPNAVGSPPRYTNYAATIVSSTSYFPTSCQLRYDTNQYHAILLPDSQQYSLAAGGTRDIYLGAPEAGTTLSVDNCAAAATGDPTLTILRDGVAITAPSTSGCGASTGVATSASVRLPGHAYVARVTCGAAACSGTLRVSRAYDFNGDLINVPAQVAAIPDGNYSDTSLLGLNDSANPSIGGDHYDSAFCSDHNQSIVRLRGNRFAVTTDIGNGGKLFLFETGSKQSVDDRVRLHTNVASSAGPPPPNDVLVASLGTIGGNRGHLSGASRSGGYLITASEADDDSVDGLVSVIDTSGNVLNKVNSYAHRDLGSTYSAGGGDGAAWASSAKLATTANVPDKLKDAHLFVAAGTAMRALDFVVKPRNPNTQLSSLTSHNEPFEAYARLPWSGSGVYADDGEFGFSGSRIIDASNNGSLITQADGTVYLLTLNGSDENRNVPWQDCNGNATGTYSLYRLVFAGQSLPHGGACSKAICIVKTAKRTLHTNGYVSMVKAAGSYYVPTGSAATEQLIVYGATGAKIDNWVRLEEF